VVPRETRFGASVGKGEITTTIGPSASFVNTQFHKLLLLRKGDLLGRMTTIALNPRQQREVEIPNLSEAKT
jgi:hypothetical protein